MRAWWCAARQSIVCESWAQHGHPCCQSVPESYEGEPPVDRGCGYMRLVPLDARIVQGDPVGMLVHGEYIPYDIWLSHLPFAGPADAVVPLYALNDTETP